MAGFKKVTTAVEKSVFDKANDKLAKDKKDEKKVGTSVIDDETGFWLNKTRSGKGVIIVIDDMAFISSLANLEEFVKGDRRGVKFNLLKTVE